MKAFAFPVVVRSSLTNDGKWSEVVLGEVKLLLKGGTSLMAVRNNETAYHYGPLEGFTLGKHWLAKGQIVHCVTYQEMLFHLNQMLWEQGKNIMEPIMDEQFKRKD